MGASTIVALSYRFLLNLSAAVTARRSATAAG
jgi:hypothetical protein